VRVDGSDDRLDRDRLHPAGVALGRRRPAGVHGQVHELVAVARPATQAPLSLSEAAFAAEAEESVLRLEPARPGEAADTVEQAIQQEQRRDETQEKTRDPSGCDRSRRERHEQQSPPQSKTLDHW
jgi:hypothetical protein